MSENFRIPATIHYVWVGGGPKSSLIRRCMRSWERHLPAYEIVEWNERNFDIAAHPYAREAYRRRMWAFVSDYIRVWAVHNYGGIYLDTDNVVQRTLDSFRRDRAFVGFERIDYPFTACFGAEKGHPFTASLLEDYARRNFTVSEDDPLPFNNTISVSKILCERFGAVCNNKEQVLAEGIRLYPDRVLCNPSPESAVIHVFTGSWLPGKTRLKRAVTSLKSHLDTPRKAALYARLSGRPL